MSVEVTTVSEQGFTTLNQFDNFKSTIDATGDSAPDTLESLVAAYASCYVPALRVGGQQRGVDDLGRIEIDATGETGDDDKLAAITFDVAVEAAVDDETASAVIERAMELCKVHDALKEELHADVSLEANAL